MCAPVPANLRVWLGDERWSRSLLRAVVIDIMPSLSSTLRRTGTVALLPFSPFMLSRGVRVLSVLSFLIAVDEARRIVVGVSVLDGAALPCRAPFA